MKKTTAAILFVTASVGLSWTIAAQGQRPSFDVASVKPNKSGDNRMMISNQPGGGMTITNLPLRALINWAYELQDFQLVDAPDWIANERFDVVAKAANDPAAAPSGPQDPRTRLMIQSLLEDRFKLAAHRDKRPLPIYTLVLARADGKPGPQLRPSTVDCAADRSGGRGGGRGGPPPGPPAPGERPTCGMFMGPGRIMAGGTSLSQLIGPLSVFSRRIVVDRTDLKGNFDIDLAWTPDQMPSGPPPPGVTMPAIDPNGPSIFTALPGAAWAQTGVANRAGRCARGRSCGAADAGLTMKKEKNRGTFLTITVVLAAAPLFTAQTVSYDVASETEQFRQARVPATSTRNGQLTATNVTLSVDDRDAYGLQDFQIARWAGGWTRIDLTSSRKQKGHPPRPSAV